MSKFTWLTTLRGPALTQEQLARRDCLSLPQGLSEVSLRQQRMIVVDLETSGLNTSRDQVLSIGAVAIEDGGIDLGSQFECTLQRDQLVLKESVLIHGIAPSALAAGTEPAEALLDFMEFVGDSPLLAFHAPFDRRMLARALKSSLGYTLRHPFLDLAEVAPMLCPHAKVGRGGLDDWVEHFGLQVQQRHNAAADALATAELALILFSRARRQELHNLLALNRRLNVWRRRRNAYSL